jgi:hypothetical protein
MLVRLLPLVVLAAPNLAQTDLLQRESLTYFACIGQAEIGREAVTLTGDGWSAKGAFDVLGTRQGEYRAQLRRGHDDAFDCELASATGGRETQVHAQFEAGRFTAKVIGTERQRSIEVQGEGAPVLFENLLWAALTSWAGRSPRATTPAVWCRAPR